MKVNYHPLYNIWLKMRHRCHNQYHHKFPMYGARGITVCPQWRASFRQFLADIPERPSPAHSLDRIDTHGHYEPGNVRWATAKEQARNRRDNVYVTLWGRERLLQDWARDFEISPCVARYRVLKGWHPEAALYLPPGTRRSLANLCADAWPDWLDASTLESLS